MKKVSTLNLRVDHDVKKCAENVLEKLGILMSVAVDMYLNQIYLTGGIPFKVTLPEAPVNINADEMSDIQLNNKLEAGCAEMKTGKVQDADQAFMKFRKEHQM